MLTIFYAAAAFLLPFVVGLPVARLLARGRALPPSGWVAAPFLGISLVILVGQNLTYLNVPASIWAPLVLAGALALWAVVLCRPRLRAGLFRRCPRLLLAAAAGVYVVHGLGLFAAGARSYLGRAWMDEYTYTSLTQMVVDLPLGTDPAALDHRPYLFSAVVERRDRLGQSVLHAFLAAACRAPARTVLVPTLLLGPALSVLAVAGLGRKLGLTPRLAALAGASAGLLPGLAAMHLEGFLSQTLATPLLLLYPALLHDLARRPGWRTLVVSAAVAAALNAVYTELLPLVAGLTVVVLAVAAAPRRRLRTWACGLGVLAAPLLLNPMYAPNTLQIMRRLDTTSVNHIFPWAFQVEGLTRIWLGDVGASWLGEPGSWMGELKTHNSGTLVLLARAAGIGLTLLGLCGLAHAVVSRLRARGDQAARQALGLAVGLSAVALGPLVFLALDDQHPYQFYKLLSTACPLLALGLALIVGATAARHGGRPAAVAVAALLGVAAAGLGATACMSLRAASAAPAPRSFGAYVVAPDFLDLQRQLERMSGQNLLLAYRDPGVPNEHVTNAWLAYAARRNRVWLGTPLVNDCCLEGETPWDACLDLAALPDDVLVLTGRSCPIRPEDLPGAEPVWGNAGYQLWRVRRPRVAVLTGVANDQGLDGRWIPEPLSIGAGSTILKIRTSAPGRVALTATFTPGPLCGPAGCCPVRVENRALGYSRTVTLGAGPQRLEAPVAAGAQSVVVTPLVPDAPPGSNAAAFQATGLRAAWLPGE